MTNGYLFTISSTLSFVMIISHPLSFDITITYKEDSFDDEVNLAQQNKPSSMGLSFFVSGDLPSFAVLVKYAKYAPVKDGDIAIPYSGDSLNIPDCLTPYISFDEKTKTIKKLQSIKWRELNDLFEQNAIEDAELLHLIGNLNSVFKEGITYRRCPFEKKSVCNLTVIWQKPKS